MNFQYDASQEKCPLPLVNLRLILKKMNKSDVCVFRIRDLGSKENIPKLLSKLGYSYNQSPIDNNVVEITITKDS
jgi:TusA-related sulfurtransferase